MSRSRRPKKKSSYKTILILCEGETEKNYFEMMKQKYRQNTVTIKTKVAKRGCSQVIEEAKSIYKNDKKYDMCYIIMDKDSCDEKELFELVQREPKIRLLFTNSCFELWLNLHYQKVTGFQNTKGQINLLEKNLGIKDYSKNKANPRILEKIKDKVHIALDNASHCNYKNASNNPFTNIHCYYKEIFNFKETDRV